MVISLRKWLRWSKFVLLFVLGTLLLYQLISWLKPWFQPDLLRQGPGDGAVKVFSTMNQITKKEDFSTQLKNRLLLYYWLDE